MKQIRNWRLDVQKTASWLVVSKITSWLRLREDCELAECEQDCKLDVTKRRLRASWTERDWLRALRSQRQIAHFYESHFCSIVFGIVDGLAPTFPAEGMPRNAWHVWESLPCLSRTTPQKPPTAQSVTPLMGQFPQPSPYNN